MIMENLSKILTEYRRDLHRIPELDFAMDETGHYIEKILGSLRCDTVRIAEFIGAVNDKKNCDRKYLGICAFFDFGYDDAIAFRSDMDALPITEKTGLPFQSEHEGAMHACGHDGHMAILLGFANVLNECKRGRGDFICAQADCAESVHEECAGCGYPKHNVLLVFQPAEETTGGAELICKTGIFKRYNVKKIFGIHLWPYITEGTISTKPGPMMAKSSEINIAIKGLSAHCTAAYEGKDALITGCRLLDKIYSFDEISEDAFSILKFGKMVSGDVRNVISSHTIIEGTLRCSDPDTFNLIVEKMENVANDMAKKTGCDINVVHSDGYAPVMNDPALYREILPELKKLDYEELKEPSMIAEDFSFYQLEMPGVFIYLGTGTGIPLHSDVFNFNEKILLNGVKAYCLIAQI